MPDVMLLHYGRQNLRWRRITLRVVAGVAFLAIIGGGVRAALPGVLRLRDQIDMQPTRRALYERCLKHTDAPGTLVFDEAADTVNIPMYSDPYLPSPPRSPAHSVAVQKTFNRHRLSWPMPRNGSQTADWLHLEDLDFKYYDNRGFVNCARNGVPTKIYSQYGAYYGGSDELFRHARRDSDGVERLVLVGFDPPAFMAGSVLPFRSQVVTMQRTYQPLKYSGQWEEGMFLFNCPASQPLKLYTGQADPSDESHFTIDYSTPAGQGVIDGWLRPDSFLYLKIRNGPATMRSSGRGQRLSTNLPRYSGWPATGNS